jgi:tRNA pseudouridine55 synthase
MSSFGVVARVRRVLTEQAGKKIKVGHTGTLDPFATGLMIIVVGSYCKRAAEFSKLDKTYETVARLGEVSTTGDPEGQVSAVSGRQPTLAEIEQVLGHFRGNIIQTPPAYSAIKIDGQRAYKLAREGKEVSMPSRTVTVAELAIIRYNYPELELRCAVSSGTYIRTLVEDVGRQLGVGAYCSSLRRTSVGQYKLEQAQGLSGEYRLLAI